MYQFGYMDTVGIHVKTQSEQHPRMHNVQTSVVLFFFSQHGLMFSSLSEVRFLFHSATSEL